VLFDLKNPSSIKEIAVWDITQKVCTVPTSKIGKVAAVVGLQWGDEGKGRMVDYLGEFYDIGARYNGGPNAEHAIVDQVTGKKMNTHNIPSIAYRQKPAVICSWVAVDPIEVKKDLETLRADPTKVLIDKRCPLVLPQHLTADKSAHAKENIQTTGRGVGPCFIDQYNRTGKRYGDFFDDGVDTQAYLQSAIRSGKSVLFESCQGTLLDIIYGTYPHVTSTITTANGAPASAGIPARWLERVYGVFKAYMTRHAAGAFPTEETSPLMDRLRIKGDDFETRYQEPHRMGWLDLDLLKFAVDLNGVTDLIMTKVDVLDGLSEVTYFKKGNLHKMAGWTLDENKIPYELMSYIKMIEEYVEVPITMISLGPERNSLHTLVRKSYP
jgi:adenylosuccinate synthase